MADQNVLALTGRLTRDPELRSLPSGESVCNFRMAVNGIREEDTCFIDVAVWGKGGDAAAQYLHQGSRVAVNGFLGVREWEDKEGGKRTNVECRSARVAFLETRAEAEAQQVAPTPAGPPVQAAPMPTAQVPPQQNFGQQPAQPQQPAQQPADDDIPF